MAIPVTCPGCGAKFRVKSEFGGKQGKCPNCAHLCEVPAAVELAPGANLTAPPVPPRTPPPKSSAAVEAMNRPARTSREVNTKPAMTPGQTELGGAEVAARNSAASTFAVDPADQEARLKRYARGRGFALPLWVWFAAGTVGLLGALGVTWRSYHRTIAEEAQRKVAAKEEQKKLIEKNERRGPKRNTEAFHKSEPVSQPTRPAEGAALEDVVEYIEHGIVKLDVYNAWNVRQGLGSGFVIDKSGLIATNYHVVAEAMKVDALFNDGTRYGIEGYVAVRPESDLAILKLNGVPDNMTVLELVSEGAPRPAAEVYAIGHPHDHQFVITRGAVGRVVKTSELPEDSRGFLESILTDKVDNVWIQHDAKISPGNSGGPLVNPRGQVLGVNSWVNTQIGLGFAVHAKTLAEMRQNLLPRVAPLREFVRQKPGTQQVQFEAGKIQELYELCIQTDWTSANDQEFDAWNHLAVILSAGKIARDTPEAVGNVPAKVLEAFVQESQAVEKSLAEFAWNAEKFVAPINLRTNARLTLQDPPPGTMGAFLFGTVEKALQQPNGSALLVKLDGHETKIFVQLAAKTTPPIQGSTCLILGLLDAGKFSYSANGQPTEELAVVRSAIVLPRVE